MIDINELRRKIISVDIADHIDIHANVKSTLAELLDRLEVEEKDIALKERIIDSLGATLNAVASERDTLRARIEEMERQEPPCGWWDDLIADVSAIDCMYRGSPTYAHDAYWMRDRVEWMLKQRRDAIPGAQSAQSALAGARKVTRDFYWDSAALHHVPFVRVEFQPVAANSPNDAKGWQDRDRFFAAMLVAAGNGVDTK